eukprot:Selendium_serpulae@DN4894_c0_g1_i5.p1
MSCPINFNMVKSQARLTERQQTIAAQRTQREHVERRTNDSSGEKQQRTKRVKTTRKADTRNPPISDDVTIERQQESVIDDGIDEFNPLVSQEMEESQNEIAKTFHNIKPGKVVTSIKSLLPTKAPKLELNTLPSNPKIEDVVNWLDRCRKWCLRYEAAEMHNSAVEWAWKNCGPISNTIDVFAVDSSFYDDYDGITELEDMLLPNIMQALPHDIQRMVRSTTERLHVAYQELLRMVIPQTSEEQLREVADLA